VRIAVGCVSIKYNDCTLELLSSPIRHRPGRLWQSPQTLQPHTTGRILFCLITQEWRKSVQGILSVGAKLIEAKASLQHGEWGQLVELLPFSDRAARMLMSIGGDLRLSNRKHVSVLPPSWGTLYELTKLDDEQCALAESEGLIQSDSVCHTEDSPIKTREIDAYQASQSL